MKKQMAWMMTALMLAGAALSTASANGGSGQDCDVKSLQTILSDLFNGKVSPLDCKY